MARRYVYPLVSKKEALEWYNNLSDSMKATVYISQFLGSNESASVHVVIRREGQRNDETMMRIGKRGLNWFEREFVPEGWMNCNLYKVTGVKK